jgi:hypothetical protein
VTIGNSINYTRKSDELTHGMAFKSGGYRVKNFEDRAARRHRHQPPALRGLEKGEAPEAAGETKLRWRRGAHAKQP